METIMGHFKESLLMLIWVVCGVMYFGGFILRRNSTVSGGYLQPSEKPLWVAVVATVLLFVWKVFFVRMWGW